MRGCATAAARSLEGTMAVVTGAQASTGKWLALRLEDVDSNDLRNASNTGQLYVVHYRNTGHNELKRRLHGVHWVLFNAHDPSVR